MPIPPCAVVSNTGEIKKTGRQEGRQEGKAVVVRVKDCALGVNVEQITHAH